MKVELVEQALLISVYLTHATSACYGYLLTGCSIRSHNFRIWIVFDENPLDHGSRIFTRPDN